MDRYLTNFVTLLMACIDTGGYRLEFFHHATELGSCTTAKYHMEYEFAPKSSTLAVTVIS